MTAPELATPPGTIARTLSIALIGLGGTAVTIEADAAPGLPGINIVGLGDTAIKEAGDRIRSAVRNSHLSWPKNKLVVSLTPASIHKTGSAYDLPIACAILGTALDAKHPGHRRLHTTALVGEIGLDGDLKPVRGVLAAALAARHNNIPTLIVAPGNAAEAALVDGITVLSAATLADVWHWIEQGDSLFDQAGPDESLRPLGVTRHPHVPLSQVAGRHRSAVEDKDMRDVIGQDAARHALEVAAAGGHHLLMVGPAGSGKSMLASRLPTIMPDLDDATALEATAVHGLNSPYDHDIIVRPPFVDPHYSVTPAALIGGGSVPTPGAISLAHGGVLFLDEAAEMRPGVLDSLRTPLEAGEVRLTRARYEVTFPAACQLVLATNHCPCGSPDPERCRCGGAARLRYRNKLSGPLLDRIDIAVETQPTTGMASSTQAGEDSATIRGRVRYARALALARWRDYGVQAAVNARVPGPWLRQWLRTQPEIAALMDYHLNDEVISQRGVDRTLRVAITLADLEVAQNPTQAGAQVDALHLRHVTLEHIDNAINLHREVHNLTA